ncbi:hypothetical protein KC338_g242 [Hortaea werneckii]|nr:hypothetical protein KC338_g242 [Hortaea werneckii]
MRVALQQSDILRRSAQAAEDGLVEIDPELGSVKLAGWHETSTMWVICRCKCEGVWGPISSELIHGARGSDMSFGDGMNQVCNLVVADAGVGNARIEKDVEGLISRFSEPKPFSNSLAPGITRIAVVAIAVAAKGCDEGSKTIYLGICRLAARWPKLYRLQIAVLAVSARSQIVRLRRRTIALTLCYALAPTLLRTTQSVPLVSIASKEDDALNVAVFTAMRAISSSAVLDLWAAYTTHRREYTDRRGCDAPPGVRASAKDPLALDTQLQNRLGRMDLRPAFASWEEGNSTGVANLLPRRQMFSNVNSAA